MAAFGYGDCPLYAAAIGRQYVYVVEMALIASGNPGMVMSPVFTNNMFDSLQQMILTGSSLMAYIPTLIFFLLGGSAYAFAQIANRANLVGQNAIREDLEAPKLETSPVIGMPGIVDPNNYGGPLSDSARLVSASDRGSSTTISLENGHSERTSASLNIADQISKLESETGQITLAQVNSDGKAISRLSSPTCVTTCRRRPARPTAAGLTSYGSTMCRA